jgi:hypothetical protein
MGGATEVDLDDGRTKFIVSTRRTIEAGSVKSPFGE